MGKNVILFGATGNAGGQLLEQSLLDDRISKVTVVSRKTCGIRHQKLVEIIHDNFLDFSTVAEGFKNQDIGFYCLGVSQLQEKDPKKYEIITHDFTIAVAEMLKKNNSEMTFCFLSGEGADTSIKSKTLFARIKGKTENSLINQNFKQLYIFRPGYIHPINMKRKKSFLENVTEVFYPIMKIFTPGIVTTSENLARVMIHIGLNGNKKELVVNKEINSINKSISHERI